MGENRPVDDTLAFSPKARACAVAAGQFAFAADAGQQMFDARKSLPMSSASAADAVVQLHTTAALVDSARAVSMAAVEAALPEAVPKANDWYQNVVFNYSDYRFQRVFRMSKRRFEEVLDYLYPPERAPFGPPPTDRRKRFACALYRLSRQVSVMDVAEKFGSGCSEGAVVKYTNELIDKLFAKRTEIIQWPSSEQQVELATPFEQRFGFPALFAVGDGTHFSIKPPVETLVDLYSCFDLSCVLGWHSMSAVGICDFGWRFLWLNSGSPGISGDSHVLQGTQFYRLAEEGGSIRADLGVGFDTAFPLTFWTWTGWKGSMTNKQAKYNMQLSRCRARIEHCWRRVFARWRSAQAVDFKFENIPRFITAVCCLHNLVEQSGEFFDEQLLQPDPGFEFCLLGERAPLPALDAADERAADADTAADREALFAALRAAATPAQRRDAVADYIWEHSQQ